MTLSNIVTIFLPDFNIVREVFLRQSRILPSSYLQNEPQVRKIRDVIASRVAGKMVELDKQDRETFSSVWADIHTFAKFGMMKDDKFYEKLKDHKFFAVTGSDEWTTLSEYLENSSAAEATTVHYTNDEVAQAT